MPVLLCFRASFCGPSQMLDPLLDIAYDTFKGTLLVADVDVEECPVMTREFGVRGTPCLLLLSGGKAIATRIGTQSEDQLLAWLEEGLQKCAGVAV